MCSHCDKDYAKLGANKCARCQNRALNLFVILILFLLFFLLLGIFIMLLYSFSLILKTIFISSLSIRQSEKLIKSHSLILLDTKIGLAIQMKIFLNYLQMISIIYSFDLKWPDYVMDYFNIFSFIGGVSTQVISLDCLLQDYQIEIQSIYIQTILNIMMPFNIVFIAGFILTILLIKKREFRGIRMIIVTIVVSIFLQPPIIKSLFDNLKCITIEKQNLLYVNMLIDCDSNEHKKWVSFIKKI